jgi:hypothetical protein
VVLPPQAKALAQSLPELTGKAVAAAAADAPESDKDGNDDGAAAATAAAADAAAADESPAAAAPATKSSWGFKLPTFTMPSLPTALVAKASDELKKCADKTDNDAALEKIGQDTKELLAAVVEADKSARALAQVLSVVDFFSFSSWFNACLLTCISGFFVCLHARTYGLRGVRVRRAHTPLRVPKGGRRSAVGPARRASRRHGHQGACARARGGLGVCVWVVGRLPVRPSAANPPTPPPAQLFLMPPVALDFAPTTEIVNTLPRIHIYIFRRYHAAPLFFPQAGGVVVLAAGLESPVLAAQQAVAAFLAESKADATASKAAAAAEAEAKGDPGATAALQQADAAADAVRVRLVLAACSSSDFLPGLILLLCFFKE